MKIIKRNGEEQDFSPEKIRRVIKLANQSVQGTDRIKSDEDVEKVLHYVVESLSKFGTVSVETVQDKIRDAFMNFNYFEVADSFIRFRQDKKAQKKFSESEENIISICNYTNEAVKQDNANKNPRVLAVQRDYISGTKCKDIAKKTLPKDIVDGHNKGLLHFHDMDYSPTQKESNCCLVYLKDMLENGFAMNSTPIHQTTQGFRTDCTLASQIAAQVAGQQYGGQTMSWAHIAKSIQISRLTIIEELIEEYNDEHFEDENYESIHLVRGEDTRAEDYYEYLSMKLSETELKNLKRKVEQRVKREIKGGVKTFQYQVLTILCSNGQTPFISMSMNLEDCEGDKQWEEDTKLVFEEVFRQRIKGIPDEHGHLVPVVFPKLLYFLDERNHEPGTENWYLTKLAAESAAKTMAPDFISAKVQKKVKKTNHSWPCMGAARGDETVSIKIDDVIYENIPFAEAYLKLRDANKVHGGGFKERNKSDISNLWGVCGVYKITHRPTGKYYIGSSKNVARRLNEHNCSISHKGALGDNFYIGDFDKENYTRELLEECDINDLLTTEFKYIDLNDENCVNKKDPRKNGNFNSKTRLIALEGKKYSNYEGKWYTIFKEVDGTRCFVQRKGEWVPIRKITYNDPERCNLALYEIEYEINGGKKVLHVTEDHPLRTQKGRTEAANIEVGDIIYNALTFEEYKVTRVEATDEKVPTYDFEVDNDMFDLSGILSYNCRSFATPYTPDPLYDDEAVGFNKGYKDTFTVKELYEMSKNDSKGLKYRMILRREGYYKGDVNEIDHFEEENGRVKLVCRPKYWGFFNGGVVTINVPHVALESHGNKAEFWRILDQRCELAYRALVERYKSLKDAPSDAAPILRQYGALMRMGTDTWNHMITGPRCTYSLGYAGLWETQLYMTGKKLTEDQSFANEVLNFFNKKHEEWHTRLMNKNDPNSWLNTSTYGTPEENLVQKFSDALKRDFGSVEGVTDHDYVTNSYHIDPAQPVDWATKITIESKMMDKSTGGAISYIELPNMENNLKAVESMIQFMYDHILYCEINVKRDICYKCGFQGVIKIVHDNGKRVWECPACRNRDTSMMHIRRRVCGYIGDANTGACQSRMGDYEARVEHANIPVEFTNIQMVNCCVA